MTLNYRQVADVWENTVQELIAPPRGRALPWWPRFNDYLGGLRPNELTLLCAPTGSGKTQFLANVVGQLVMQDVSVFAAPVETGDSDFVARVVSSLEGVSLNDGNPVPRDRLSRITAKYSHSLFGRNFFLSTYDNRVEVEEMINMLKFMHQEHGVAVAVLDNLNFFLKVTSSQMEKAEMDNVIHEFVMLGKHIPMHIILVVHPRKTMDGRVESEFDIKGSSTAVQEAPNVCLFNRPKSADVENGRKKFTDRELVFRKIRKRGWNVGKPIWFAFEGGRYGELVYEGK